MLYFYLMKRSRNLMDYYIRLKKPPLCKGRGTTVGGGRVVRLATANPN